MAYRDIKPGQTINYGNIKKWNRNDLSHFELSIFIFFVWFSPADEIFSVLLWKMVENWKKKVENAPLERKYAFGIYRAFARLSVISGDFSADFAQQFIFYECRGMFFRIYGNLMMFA